MTAQRPKLTDVAEFGIHIMNPEHRCCRCKRTTRGYSEGLFADDLCGDCNSINVRPRDQRPSYLSRREAVFYRPRSVYVMHPIPISVRYGLCGMVCYSHSAVSPLTPAWSRSTTCCTLAATTATTYRSTAGTARWPANSAWSWTRSTWKGFTRRNRALERRRIAGGLRCLCTNGRRAASPHPLFW